MGEKELTRNERRERKRQKVQSGADDRRLIVIPADPAKSLSDETVEKRVCAYCRVSTDDPAQTTSYELQKKHYEELINETPGWTFAGIYADEGISATSLKNRDEFNRMIADCEAGKIDVIITKNVSRFARNVFKIDGDADEGLQRRAVQGMDLPGQAQGQERERLHEPHDKGD